MLPSHPADARTRKQVTAARPRPRRCWRRFGRRAGRARIERQQRVDCTTRRRLGRLRAWVRRIAPLFAGSTMGRLTRALTPPHTHTHARARARAHAHAHAHRTHARAHTHHLRTRARVTTYHACMVPCSTNGARAMRDTGWWVQIRVNGDRICYILVSACCPGARPTYVCDCPRRPPCVHASLCFSADVRKRRRLVDVELLDLSAVAAVDGAGRAGAAGRAAPTTTACGRRWRRWWWRRWWGRRWWGRRRCWLGQRCGVAPAALCGGRRGASKRLRAIS